MTAPQVSIVIVNYNTRDATLACLDSLRDGTDYTFEVVLVDNGSVDGSVAAIRAAHPNVVVVEAGANLGFAAGVNLGVRHSRGAWVLLLNPDTAVGPKSLVLLRDFALAHPQNRMYGGRTLRPDGGVDPSSCWGEPSTWSLFCFATGLSTAFAASRVFDPESLGGWQRDTVREVPIITGCLLLISREDWDALGGMDERYFLYGEDADFSMRARDLGMRPVIVPQATIVHEVGGSTESSGRKMCMVLAGKATLLRSRHGSIRARVEVGMLETGAALRALLEVVTRRTTSTWRTVWRRRADWRLGYPHARAAIFGMDSVVTV